MVTVTYELTNNDELAISYEAETDKTTVVNLTHHSYFNLRDGGRSEITNHKLQIYSSAYLPVTEDLMPNGVVSLVANTPFDFREEMCIGARIDEEDTQLLRGGGYDHTYVLEGKGIRAVAQVIEDQSGRYIKVLTDEPGIQFYSGHGIDGTIYGKYGITYGDRHGFCLETQHFPDSPNQPHFPSTLLHPNEKYTSLSIYKFGTI
jgi:aldose 1-epimerase